jgi:hypothetical protein
VGILSSLVADFDARQRSAGMSFFVIEQLAVPTPQALQEQLPWLGCSGAEWLGPRVFELSFTSCDLAPLAADLGLATMPFRWLPERRERLQAEIDAAVLHLYQLERAKVELLLDSFTVLRKYEERDHGDFRTKSRILELYDRMQQAIDSGTAFISDLDPPPADPRAAHSELNSRSRYTSQ